MFVLLLALLAPAFAEDGAPDGPVEEPAETPVAAEPEPPAYPELTDAASGIDLVHAAVARMRLGDYEGAALLLDRAVERDPSLTVEVAYQRANVLALQRDYAASREVFRAISDSPASHRTDDARFRVAELTGVLGDPEAAIAGLEALEPWDRFDAADRAKLELNHAIFTLEAGNTRRARRRLTRVLRRTEPGTVSYYEAKAWAALARERLDRADALVLGTRQRKIRKQLAARQALILSAEAAVRQTIRLQEPEWLFDGLLRLAASFERFGDDLLAAPEPDDLTPEQLAIYRSSLRDEVDPVWVRALAYLDEGVSLAERLQHTGWRVDALRRERDRVREKVGGL